MSFGENLKPSPMVRPMLNMGCLFDIPTGRYYLGARGESILNGGLAYLTGIGGRGNVFKSTIGHHFHLSVLARYLCSDDAVYDTEMSATTGRMAELSARMPGLEDFDFDNTPTRFILTDKTMYSGSEFYEKHREYMNEKQKDEKSNLRTTPFLDAHGKHIVAMRPSAVFYDSLSMFTSDSVLKIQGGGIGESDRNMEAMRDASAKTQMLMEMPTSTARSGTYAIFSAHMGDEHQLDPYAPPAKKLSFLKGKVKFKNVPEKFTFLMNNCWYCMTSAPLINQTTKAPEFPRNSDDDLKGDTDLMFVTIMNLRPKNGPAGMPFDIIVSQSEGVLVGLTEFYYIKEMDRYGMGGNVQNYYLELLPDVKLSRTTVRGKIAENRKLQRALEITSEMCQMQNLWHDMPAGVMCTPKELYEDIKAKGYDWDRLLETRGFWVFEEDKHPLPFLSTMDLLNMRAGTYRPYWYDKGN